MRKQLLVLAMLLAGSPLLAQNVLFDGTVDMGGYGGPSVRVGQFNDQTGLLVGGAGGWLIDHRLTVGLAGYGLATIVEPNVPGRDSMRMDLGYGGGYIDYQFMPDNVVHPGVHVLVGAGGMNYGRRATHHEAGSTSYESTDAFFVVEPGVSAEVNLLRNLRLSVDASYRFVNGIDDPASSDEDLSGPSAGLTLKIGSF